MERRGEQVQGVARTQTIVVSNTNRGKSDKCSKSYIKYDGCCCGVGAERAAVRYPLVLLEGRSLFPLWGDQKADGDGSFVFLLINLIEVMGGFKLACFGPSSNGNLYHSSGGGIACLYTCVILGLFGGCVLLQQPTAALTLHVRI